MTAFPLKCAGTVVFLVFCAGANAQAPKDSVPPIPELKAGWWLLPKTDIRMTTAGYIKFDLIHDRKPIGSPNFFDVSKIPTNDAVGTSTHMQAQETRLWLDVPIGLLGCACFDRVDHDNLRAARACCCRCWCCRWRCRCSSSARAGWISRSLASRPVDRRCCWARWRY